MPHADVLIITGVAFGCSTYFVKRKFPSAHEWLFYRLRSGFGSQCYVTWFIGQNRSITYEKGFQAGAAVQAANGPASRLVTHRCAAESSLSVSLSPFIAIRSCFQASFLHFGGTVTHTTHPDRRTESSVSHLIKWRQSAAAISLFFLSSLL